MRDYEFEYTDLKQILILQGLCFLVFLILLIGLIVTIDLIGIAVGLILTFGVPILIFFLNKRKLKKLGKASISNSHADFKLEKSNQKVIYADIDSYQVTRYNGAALVIKLKGGNEFKLHANANFCKADQFDAFCTDFEKLIQEFKTNNNSVLTRQPSIFERAWMLPFLVIMTVGLIGALIFVVSRGQNIPPTLFTTAAIIIPMWIGYINARKRKIEHKN